MPLINPTSFLSEAQAVTSSLASTEQSTEPEDSSSVWSSPLLPLSSSKAWRSLSRWWRYQRVQSSFKKSQSSRRRSMNASLGSCQVTRTPGTQTSSSSRSLEPSLTSSLKGATPRWWRRSCPTSQFSSSCPKTKCRLERKSSSDSTSSPDPSLTTRLICSFVPSQRHLLPSNSSLRNCWSRVSQSRKRNSSQSPKTGHKGANGDSSTFSDTSAVSW